MQRIRGFTLIELIIVSVIVSIMAAVLSPLMRSSLTAYDKTLGDVVVLDKLRYATERLAREIRGVQYASTTDTTSPTYCSGTTTDTNHYCFTAMDASGMAFKRSYVDAAGTVTSQTVTIGTAAATTTPPVTAAVTLAYSGVSSGTAQILTDELGTLTFKYYKKNGTELPPGPATTTGTALASNNACYTDTTSPCVSYIQIELTLMHNSLPYTQRTQVGLRTLPI